MPVPETAWQFISMNFGVGLLECERFAAIYVAVVRLSKLQHFILCHTTIDASGLAELVLWEVVCLHGLPVTIILDRGRQFHLVFWGMLCNHLGTECRMSTAFHPQTDGQTEQMNASIEPYLRIFVNYQQDDWVKWLPIAEFAANNGTSKTTQCTLYCALVRTVSQMTLSEAIEASHDQRLIEVDCVWLTMEQNHQHLPVER